MKRLAAVFLACQVSATAAAEPLGRLFFTPEQRTQLDMMRKQRAHRPPPMETAAPPEAPPPAIVTYSGMVRRTDGRSTAWINNRPVHDRASADSDGPRARVDEDGAARITLPQQGSVRLKVGQTAELASGRIAESYARRTPRRPAAVPPPVAEPSLRLRRRFDDDRDAPQEKAP
jgi:hypothetical protein